MPKVIVLSDSETISFSNALDFAKTWCINNQWAVGIGEMAVGAGLVAWGVNNGVIEMGTQLVATQNGGTNASSLIGAFSGSGIGVIAGSIVGSIGIVGMGGAIGVPAALVIGGAATVLGLAGYTTGDVAYNIANQAVDINALVSNGSVLLVGVALILDGARRCMNDSNVIFALSNFKENIISLKDISVQIVAETIKELDSTSIGAGALGAGIGATAGSAIAAGSVTVLGSKVLGGAAISLGLVAAPIWPIIAGIIGGVIIAFSATRYWLKKNSTDNNC